MLFIVLKENLKVEFRDFGIIEIPKGTAVDHKRNEGLDSYYSVCEFGWIDERYPQQSERMKNEAQEHGIPIQEEKLIKALRVRFLYGDSGFCRDIYKAINGKYKYCRMGMHRYDAIDWLTVTPDWEEPDCPLRTDIQIQIADKEGRVIIITKRQENIEDQDKFTSGKAFPFSWEKPATEEEQELMNLIYNM